MSRIRFLKAHKINLTKRYSNREPFTAIGMKLQSIKDSVHFQKNLLKYGIVAGIVSTVVITVYTVSSMKLQLLEMEKTNLDILIKQHELEILRRKLYPECSQKSEGQILENKKSWGEWTRAIFVSSQ